MAERTERSTAGIVAQILDERACPSQEGTLRAARFSLIALDEGEDEDLPQALADRLDITLDLNGVSIREADASLSAGALPGKKEIDRVQIPEGIEKAFAELSLHFPGGSLRKLIALNRLAGTIAALERASTVNETHAAAAIRLCAGVSLGEVANGEPETMHQETNGAHPDQQDHGSQDDYSNGSDNDSTGDAENAADMLVAIQAAAHVAALKLDRQEQRRSRASAKTGKSGARTMKSRRGRPVGLALQPPYPEARPDVPATLRTAIPWQKLRKRGLGAETGAGPGPLKILPSDFRYARYAHHTESTAIFAVDASGSTALARLTEAKGAIELLLADCYVRRDNVALIAFRGTGAETLLEPTRSLVRAKRSLTGLPGGGPTPLAKGIARSLELAGSVRRRGQSPLIVYLTDGNGNIALDGKADRAQAKSEADRLARQSAALGYRSIVIDIANRPRDTARALAEAMKAEYCPLPFASAAAVSTIVGRRLQAG